MGGIFPVRGTFLEHFLSTACRFILMEGSSQSKASTIFSSSHPEGRVSFERGCCAPLAEIKSNDDGPRRRTRLFPGRAREAVLRCARLRGRLSHTLPPHHSNPFFPLSASCNTLSLRAQIRVRARHARTLYNVVLWIFSHSRAKQEWPRYWHTPAVSHHHPPTEAPPSDHPLW